MLTSMDRGRQVIRSSLCIIMKFFEQETQREKAKCFRYWLWKSYSSEKGTVQVIVTQEKLIQGSK